MMPFWLINDKAQTSAAECKGVQWTPADSQVQEILKDFAIIWILEEKKPSQHTRADGASVRATWPREDVRTVYDKIASFIINGLIPYLQQVSNDT